MISHQLGEDKPSSITSYVQGSFASALFDARHLPACADNIVTAPVPGKVFDRTQHGPGFLAHRVGKCCDSLPLYRISLGLLFELRAVSRAAWSTAMIAFSPRQRVLLRDAVVLHDRPDGVRDDDGSCFGSLGSVRCGVLGVSYPQRFFTLLTSVANQQRDALAETLRRRGFDGIGLPGFRLVAELERGRTK